MRVATTCGVEEARLALKNSPARSRAIPRDIKKIRASIFAGTI